MREGRFTRGGRTWMFDWVTANIAEKKTCTTFLCMIALKNKTAVHTFLPSFNNANGRLCQEGLLGFRNFATMLLLSIRLILDDPHTHWCSSALKVSVICRY